MEPVTAILGLISFATGTLGFLVTGVEAAVVQGSLIADVSDRLKDYFRRTQRSRLKLQQWHMLWCYRYDFNKRADVFKNLWGERGYRNIVTTIEEIQRLSSRIHGSLSIPLDPQSFDSEPQALLENVGIRKWELARWRAIVKEARDNNEDKGSLRKLVEVCQKRVPVANMKNFLKGVKMILGQDKLLEKYVVQLESATDALGSLSHELYTNLQLDHTLKIQSSEDILSLQQAREFLDSFHSFANQLHARMETSKRNQEWHIELRMINLYELVENLKDTAQIDLDFTVRWQPTSENYPQLRRRKLIFKLGNLNADDTFRALEKSLDDSKGKALEDVTIGSVQVLVPDPLNRSLSLKKRLIEMHNDIKQHCEAERLGLETLPAKEAIRGEKTKMRKAWEVDRATIALGLVNWNLTLWQTKWFSLPCTCGIRRTNIKPADWRYTFYSERVHDGRDCQGLARLVDPLKLLGTMLAEIAILEPLVLQFNAEDEVSFRYYDVSLSRRELLDAVRSCTNILYKDAVGYCLDWRKYDAHRQLRPEDLYTYREKILVPVKSWYEAVIEKWKPGRQSWRDGLSKTAMWPSEQAWSATDVQEAG